MALHLTYGNGLTPLKFNTAAPQENASAEARMQEMQSAYDAYSKSEEYYNEAVQDYQTAQENYNSRISKLQQAYESGNPDAVAAADAELRNAAVMYNNAVDTLQQRQTAYNSMLNQVASAGLISTDEARYYQQSASADKVDLDSVDTLSQTAFQSASLRFNYESRANDAQRAADAYNELAAQYNAATTADERAQLESKLSDAIDAYNEAATQYNIAWQKGVDSRELSGGSKLDYLSAPVKPLPDANGIAETSLAAAEAERKRMNPIETIQQWGENIKSGIGYAAASGIKAITTGPNGKREYNELNVFEKLGVNALGGVLLAQATGAVVDKTANDFLGDTYKVGQFVNPSDENVIAVREEKTEMIHSFFDNMINESKADAAEALLKGGFGSTLTAAVNLGEAGLLTGMRDLGLSIVSEKKSEEEQKQATYNLQTGIADTLKSGVNPINDLLGKGIEASRDYQYYGLIGDDGQIHPPGLLEGAALGLVGGGVFAPVIAAEGGLAMPTAATLKSLLTGSVSSVPVEGMTAAQAIGKDVLFSGGRAGAAEFASAVKNTDSGTKAAAGLFSINVFSDSADSFSLKADVFSDSSIAEENYPARKDKLDDLRRSGFGGNVFRDVDFNMDSYSSRTKTSEMNLFDSVFESPNPSKVSDTVKYGFIGDSIFGDANRVEFDRDTKYREETRYEYDYIYETPRARSTRSKPRELNWDDDDILEESTSRKKKKSRVNIWEEILEV